MHCLRTKLFLIIEKIKILSVIRGSIVNEIYTLWYYKITKLSYNTKFCKKCQFFSSIWYSSVFKFYMSCNINKKIKYLLTIYRHRLDYSKVIYAIKIKENIKTKILLLNR